MRLGRCIEQSVFVSIVFIHSPSYKPQLKFGLHSGNIVCSCYDTWNLINKCFCAGNLVNKLMK